jgi:formate dehydrogenase subunit gamma
MTRYIKRHSLQARIIHGVVGISCILLAISGLFVFIPPLAAAVPAQVTFAIRMAHRVVGIIFVLAPIVSAIMSPKGFKHEVKKYTFRWSKDDVTWLKKFVPYMLSPKKTHMPDQGEMKSGQVVADGALMLGAFFIGISGVILLVGTTLFSFPPTLLLVARLVHDVAFIWLIVFGLAHLYLGFGIFPPYRNTRNLMYGDGTVSESDALYHWGNWACEEIEKGDKIIEKDD